MILTGCKNNCVGLTRKVWYIIVHDHCLYSRMSAIAVTQTASPTTVPTPTPSPSGQFDHNDV